MFCIYYLLYFRVLMMTSVISITCRILRHTVEFS